MTHQLQFLTNVQKILVLKEGKQLALGNLKAIAETGFDMVEILQAHNKELQKGAGGKTHFSERDKGILKQLMKEIDIGDVEISPEHPKEPDVAPEQTEVAKGGAPEHDLIVAEEVEKGFVGLDDLNSYLGYAWAGRWSYVWYFVFSIASGVLQLGTTYFVALWAEQDLETQQEAIWPLQFIGITAGYMLATFLRAVVVFTIMLSASLNMHEQMVVSIARAPIRFFDSNPVGRIQTRFSKDVSTLDILLPGIAVFTSNGIWRAICVFVVMMVLQPWLVIVMSGLLVIMAMVFNYAIRAMIQA